MVLAGQGNRCQSVFVWIEGAMRRCAAKTVADAPRLKSESGFNCGVSQAPGRRRRVEVVLFLLRIF